MKLNKSTLRAVVPATLTAIALIFSGPPEATAAGNQQPGQSAQDGTSKQSQSKSASIRLVDAQTLMNAPVKGKNGDKVGNVKFLMIDPDGGDVVFALISSWQNSSDFIAVPWDKIDVAGWNAATTGGKSSKSATAGQDSALSLRVPASAIQNAMRYKVDNIAQLTTPQEQLRVYNFWAPLEASQGQAGRTDSQRADESSPGAQTAQQGQNTAGDNTGRQSAQQKGDGSQASAGSESAAKAYVFVGQGFVGTVADPLLTLDNKLAGSTVHGAGSSGNEIGEIDTLAVDVENGRVAYVLVTTARQLGMGGDQVPIPMQALEWSEQGRYLLSQKHADKLGKTGTAAGGDFPSSMQKSELQRLYEHFGLQPYWQS